MEKLLVGWMQGGRNARRPRFSGAAFSKTKLIYLFSVVVGHGAAHHRRWYDDGKLRGGLSGSKSWAALIQPKGGCVKRGERETCNSIAYGPLIGCRADPSRMACKKRQTIA